VGGAEEALIVSNRPPLLERIISPRGPDHGAIALRTQADRPAGFARFGLPVLNDGGFVGAGPVADGVAGASVDGCTGRGAAADRDEGHAVHLNGPSVRAASGGRALVGEGAGYLSRRSGARPLPKASPFRHFGSPMPQRIAVLIRMRWVNFPVLAFDPFGNVNRPAALAAVEAVAVRADVGDKL
jgi:molybdenum cofactor guanylyltransferase